MQVETRNTKAFLKVGDEWQEIKFISDFGIDMPSQHTEECFWGATESFSGSAELEFKGTAALATELRKKPKLEAWKADGKRKKPRIK